MNDIILRLYLLFEGRMNRMNFFTGTFVMLVAFTLAMVIEEKVPALLSEEQGLALSVLITLLFMFVWSIHLVRRLHDLDRSGKEALWMLVPVHNLIFLSKLLFLKGTEGENQYGVDSVLSKLK
jgi:uncharacterized membrane protein YhaH (DUF805 family)